MLGKEKCKIAFDEGRGRGGEREGKVRGRGEEGRGEGNVIYMDLITHNG